MIKTKMKFLVILALLLGTMGMIPGHAIRVTPLTVTMNVPSGDQYYNTYITVSATSNKAAYLKIYYDSTLIASKSSSTSLTKTIKLTHTTNPSQFKATALAYEGELNRQTDSDTKYVYLHDQTYTLTFAGRVTDSSNGHIIEGYAVKVSGQGITTDTYSTNTYGNYYIVTSATIPVGATTTATVQAYDPASLDRHAGQSTTETVSATQTFSNNFALERVDPLILATQSLYQRAQLDWYDPETGSEACENPVGFNIDAEGMGDTLYQLNSDYTNFVTVDVETFGADCGFSDGDNVAKKITIDVYVNSAKWWTDPSDVFIESNDVNWDASQWNLGTRIDYSFGVEAFGFGFEFGIDIPDTFSVNNDLIQTGLDQVYGWYIGKIDVDFSGNSYRDASASGTFAFDTISDSGLIDKLYGHHLIYNVVVGIEFYNRQLILGKFPVWDYRGSIGYLYTLGDGYTPSWAISGRDYINHLLPIS